jgi:hypothetical protein
MGDFEDALANAHAVTRLYFDCREGALDARVLALQHLEQLQLRECPPDLVLPEELLALPRLRHLGMTGQDGQLVVPELVRRLPIERLDVWDLHAGDLPPLPGLRHLEIVVKDPRSEVAILAERFHQLVHLEVWGSHLESGELPDDVERFSRLETLMLVSCGVATLPDAMAKLHALRTFGVRGCPMTQLPEVLTRMPDLAELRIGVELTGLPASLPDMTGLRVLDLGSALNNGAMVSRYDDVANLKALPRVLGELVGLERLNLDCCGVFEVTPLRPLAKLRSLSLSWAGIEDASTLGELASLEELSIESCDRIRDLSPLAKLRQLRVLNLGNTRPKSLDVLRRLPALRELRIEGIEADRIDAVFELDLELHADDEVIERYAARASLRALPAISEIASSLDTRELVVVEAACEQLTTWAVTSTTRGKNAMTALGVTPVVEQEDADEEEDDDDDDDDGWAVSTPPGGGWLPPLDLALDRHLGKLQPGVLARLFGALFRDTGDNFPATARIAKELVSRGNAAGIDGAQIAMVEGFARANEYYDPGHREHGHGVHDTLIDVVFPLLRAPALTTLLAWCSDGHLDEDHGDAMLGLFRPALERAGDLELPKLVERLEAFLANAIEQRSGFEVAERVWTMLAGLRGPARDAVAALRGRLEVKLGAARRRDELETQLADPATAARAIAEVAALTDAELERFTGALWRTNDCEDLPTEARRALLVLWERLKRADGISGALATFARTLSVSELRTDLDVLAADEGARGKLLRRAVQRGLEAEDYPPAALERLRVVATEHDQLSRAAADSAEVRALLYGGATSYEQDRFVLGLAALATLEHNEPAGVEETADDSELATMIAHLAECSEFEVLGQFARQLHKLRITGQPLERMLAQLVAVCMLAGDGDGLEVVMPLVPPTITWDILAYNLACKSARDGDRAATLQYTKRALELGKSPDQFLDDSDFEDLADDAGFLALLDAHR